MNCSECKDYSFALRRCIKGMINPRTIKGGLGAARLMGISYICPLSSLKQKITVRLIEEVENARR